jgi:NAD(P)H-flavin reductase
MSASSLYRPHLSTIVQIEQETPDTQTFFLSANGLGWQRNYQPGQFVELSVWGGRRCSAWPRARRSGSSRSRSEDRLDQPPARTARDVVGSGPFGNCFPFERKEGLPVGGGIGLPPLRRSSLRA